MAGRELRVQRVLRAPAAIVWRALTERDLIAEWLMPNDFAPEVGHRFRMQADPGPGFDGRVEAEVLALEPPRRMVWRWRGGPIDTEVTFELEALGPDRARLTVTQRGFTGARGYLVGAVLRLGWWRLLRGALARTAARLAPP